MQPASITRRRWIGGIALVGALAMLIAGQTFLGDRLKGTTYLLYWLVCFALTFCAIITAFLDIRALQRHVHDEQRGLLEGTIKKIETEAKSRKSKK